MLLDADDEADAEVLVVGEIRVRSASYIVQL
jgi:hypothetical protein